MNNAQAPNTRIPDQQRLLAPDLARGIMLLLIAIANVSVYLWGQPTSGYTAHPIDGSTLDRVLAAMTMVFVDGRIYPMFAFLFGYGMLQFTMTRLDRGVPLDTVSRMLMRRHLWLILFGAVHAVLLFAGDVLGAYGLTGVLVASLLLRAQDRTLRIILWSVSAIVAATMLLFALLLFVLDAFVPAGFLDMTGLQGAETEGFDLASLGAADLMAGIDSWWLAMLLRFGVWILSTPGAVLTLMVPVCVLLGGYAARHHWLQTTGRRFKLGAVAAIGISLAALSGLPLALSHLGVAPMSELTAVAWLMLSQLFGIAGGVGYAALFALIGLKLQSRGRVAGITRMVAAVGQRSLSFYLLQSLVFAPLLSAWGFGLGSQIGTTTAFTIALAVWVVSVAIAAWLDHEGRRGPAEVLLRRVTYGRDATGSR